MMHFRFATFIYISFAFHGFLFLLFRVGGELWISPAESQEIRIRTDKGNLSSTKLKVILPGYQRQKLREHSSSSSTPEGSNPWDPEIDAFRLSLGYPPSALERGLESDCEWIVTVAESGKVEKLVVVRPCQYRIFESSFEKTIKNWEFPRAAGKQIRIPVRFQIQNGNEIKSR
jgi:TonB family protein